MWGRGGSFDNIFITGNDDADSCPDRPSHHAPAPSIERRQQSRPATHAAIARIDRTGADGWPIFMRAIVFTMVQHISPSGGNRAAFEIRAQQVKHRGQRQLVRSRQCTAIFGVERLPHCVVKRLHENHPPRGH